jgi:hypothetical protein
MFRTSTIGFLTRAVLTAPLFLVCFTFVFAKDQMTSSMLIGNARIDIKIEDTTLRVPAEDIFRWVKSAAQSVATY